MMKTPARFLCALLALGLCAGLVLHRSPAFSREAAQTPAPVQAAPSPFADVAPDSWYGDAVLWCREAGIMKGVSQTSFAPEQPMTRAMLATVLYQGAGSPPVPTPAAFPDVPAGSWYADGVAWAQERGIVSGYEDGRFGSGDPVTREQAVTILWRAQGQPAPGEAEPFADQIRVAPYAAQAVLWARSSGLIQGGEGNRFDPRGQLTRAQAAVLLYNAGHSPSPPDQPQVPDSPGQPGASPVFFTRDLSSAGLLAAYEALDWTPTGKVAVKVSTGEPPASNYLRPELIRDVVQAVEGTIVECNTAYGGSRAETAMHLQVARDHGFTDIAPVEILDAEGSVQLPVEGGTHLETDYVGAAFPDYGSCLVLSHFKGHSMAGFGGAIKNISIGLASREGKSLIHSGGTSHTNPWGGDQTAFLESMAEAGKAVSDWLDRGERIVYINVLNNLSVDCDCDGNPAQPDIHDIGILASRDPVAIDQAAIDLCFAAEGSESLQQRVERQDGLHTLEYAQAIGLGSRSYQLVELP